MPTTRPMRLAEADLRPAIERAAGFPYGDMLEDDFYIREVSVDPAFGRRGRGPALMAAAEAEARARGWPALWLTTFRDVPWNAPWYARLGFEPAPEDETLWPPIWNGSGRAIDRRAWRCASS